MKLAVAPGKTGFIYEQVKQHLREQMAAGTLPVGARIPSEHELMATLGASRMTVHRALREMSADGLLHRVQGVGSFVRRPAGGSALVEIFDIAEDIARRGHEHRARVVRLAAVRADAELASTFGIRPGALLLHSLIVHAEQSVPVQLEARYVSPRFAPDYLAQDFSAQTTNRYLQSIAPPHELEHVVQAVLPDADEREWLQIAAGEPCLLVERRTWTRDGPATRSRLLHPGTRYHLASRYETSEIRSF
jgi:GntR family histidine utilization transcriptional repressor